MYIIKNALRNISRSKTRNILLGIIICIIGISSCVCLSINNAAKEVVDSVKESQEVLATLDIDRENLRNGVKDGNFSRDSIEKMGSISIEKVKEYADSKYVKEYKVTSQINLDAKEIESVSNDNYFTKMEIGNPNNNSKGNSFGMTNSQKIGDFSLVGYNSYNAMSEFVSGEYKLSSGQMLDMNDTTAKCLVSNELAQENELKIGDKITFVNPNNENETYEFEIIGIYEQTTTDENSNGMINLFSQSSNKILTNYGAIQNIINKSSENEDNKIIANNNVSFVLNNINDVKAFKEEVNKKGMIEGYTITTNEESILKTVEPIQNVSKFSNMFLIIILVIGAIVLIVLNMINIRERRYEIGVLRAIGMKKHKVCLQFITEIFVVTFTFVILGTLIGSIISVPTANYMLESQITSIQNEQEQINQNFGGGMRVQSSGGVSSKGFINMMNEDVKYLDKINAVIDFSTIFELLGITILLTLISSVISIITIIRYNPLKILNTRT